MANVRRTAMGDGVDMDMLRLANENTIAVGNMKVNARGDQLGPGGKVIKTRAQVMSDHHALNMSTQLVSHDDEIRESISAEPEILVQQTSNVLQSLSVDEPIAESESVPSYTKPRGSFAGAVANQTEVTQELLDPVISRNPSNGIQRI
jgi:hypothetical protein